MGKQSRRRQLEQQRKQEIQEEKTRIQQEATRRKKKELDDFKELLKRSGRWEKAESLRRYIDTVEEKATLNNAVSEEQEVWLAWARGKADWYDPLIEAKDKLLQDVDRDDHTNKTETNRFSYY